MKELVVCTFAGCNQIYNDARILPCGNRTCAAHIDAMMVKRDAVDHEEMIKCHFCEEIHSFPDNGDGFPVDKITPLLWNIKYCTEHDAAKKSYSDVSTLLEKLIELDKEDYVIDYFERVETEILLEKEANLQKLLAHYQRLVNDVHERKVKCLSNLKTNTTLEGELEAIRRTLLEHDDKLKRDNVDFMLKTLDGDEAKWKEIQYECNILLETTKSLCEELKAKIVGDQMTSFIASTQSGTQIENSFGHLDVTTSYSTILFNKKRMNDLIQLCKLSGKQFKLLYRASRDGFAAADFHAKCDNHPRTLTIIKTTKGYIFGGYTSVAWNSASTWKADRNAFIFSLVNIRSMPLLIPVKNGDQYSINCNGAYGPTFGGSHDIHIANNSNTSNISYSKLGFSYNFTSFSLQTTEANSFLAGSYYFQTSEIEVFQLN